jgi:hypothetical protein
MSTRKHRLGRITRLEERLRDVRRSELARADRARETAEAEEARAQRTLDVHRRALVAGGEIDAVELQSRFDCLEWARRDRDRAAEQRHAAEVERERRRQVLEETGRKAASLGVVYERVLVEEHRALRRREQALSDEVGGRRVALGRLR